MKIRKANIVHEQTTTNVYIYENKKEEYIVIAIPDIEWSFSVHYEEDTETLKERLFSSLAKVLTEEHVEPLVNKLLYWIREM
jgi:hypothetical protein